MEFMIEKLKLLYILPALTLITIPLSPASEILADDKLSEKYLGVSSCASSVCHGSATAKPSSRVLLNEYTTWFQLDAHRKAYDTLLNEDSKIIAKHLGIEKPEESEKCLKCHSTHVPEAQKGEKFRTSDGVGCESCHGAAENYISTHTKPDRAYSENINDGLTDLSSLKVRTKICLDCHMGNDSQYVDHTLIGAGHPRLSFELDTYSILQPKHWKVDKDYIERKGEYIASKAWITGQLYRAQEMIEALQSKKRSKSGIMPELSNYYCYSCHHNLKDEQWKTRTYQGEPGTLRLNISSLTMLSLALETLDKDLAKSFKNKINKLQSAHLNGNDKELLREIHTDINKKIKPTIEKTNFSTEINQNLLKEFTNYSATNKYLQYEVAEQIVMALSALISQNQNVKPEIRNQINNVYRTLRHEKDFKPEEYSQESQKLKEIIEKFDY